METARAGADLLDLEVYRKACELKGGVITLLGKAVRRPDEMGRQALGSACSVSANIAEAYGRFGFKDRIQFLYCSRGSAWELTDHLHSIALVAPEKAADVERLTADARQVIRMSNGYIRSLRRQSTQP